MHALKLVVAQPSWMQGMDVVRKIEALNGTPPSKECEIADSGELTIEPYHMEM